MNSENKFEVEDFQRIDFFLLKAYVLFELIHNFSFQPKVFISISTLFKKLGISTKG